MKKLLSKKTVIIIIVISVILLLLVGSLYLYKDLRNNTFYSKTFVSTIDISEKSNDKAKNLIEEKIDSLKSTGLEFDLNGVKVTLAFEDIGIDFKVQETLDQIQKIDSSKLSLIDFYLNKNEVKNITLIYSIDNENLLNNIEASLQIRDIRAISSSFYLDEDSNLKISEEIDGFQINQEKLLNEINDLISTLDKKAINLELIDEKPLITKASISEEQISKMQSLLNKKITLIDPVYSDNWEIKLIDYPTWVDFDNSTPNIKIRIVHDELNKFIDEEISKWLDKSAENVKIYTDENGEVLIEGKGSDGMNVKREFLALEIENAINNDKDQIEIPIEKTKPIINVSEDLQALGIKERISVGHTSYYGSHTNRIHNIKTGAANFNGKIIKPGEEFSFNTNLGAVNAATRYKTELVIKAEGTIPEYGGGLCQVSTTMYRTVLFSGLPITDRRSHTYAVSYYSQILGHGLDATIYLGGQDLKFVNDTGSSILIQAYTENDYELFIVFYGSSDGRSVEMEGPYLSNYHSPGATQYIDTPTLAPGATKQVENRHIGFTALWYRYLTDKDGNVVKEEIPSYYKAIPAKVLVGI